MLEPGLYEDVNKVQQILIGQRSYIRFERGEAFESAGAAIGAMFDTIKCHHHSVTLYMSLRPAPRSYLKQPTSARFGR